MLRPHMDGFVVLEIRNGEMIKVRGQTGSVHAGAQTEVTLKSQGLIYYKLKLYQVASESSLLGQKRADLDACVSVKGPHV